MAHISYYKVLGIDKSATQAEIKEAHRKRTKQFHTDKNQEDPKAKAKMQLVNEAYRVLKDPKTRTYYDRYGERWEEMKKMEEAGAGQYWGGPGNQGGTYGRSAGNNPFENMNFNMDDLGSIFGNIFGGHQRGGHRSEPVVEDAEATVDVDFYTAVLGGEIMIGVNGSKFKMKIKPGTQPGTKVRLRGKGYERPNGTKTDLILTYNVRIPDNLSDKQKDLLIKMRDS